MPDRDATHDDLIDRNDATALAAMVARRDITPAELLELAIARANATAGLNHTPIRFDDVARARAAGPLSGPFAGVPFLLKDIGQEYAGQPHTAAAAPYRNRIAAAHSTYTQRCLDAGLVIFGRTATPELGLRGQTESRLWGPTRNPWDTARTPGGSSGGSAAAVAARVVPMAGANDGGGSIRIPASYCGLFGLKPSTNRVSWGPAEGLIWKAPAPTMCSATACAIPPPCSMRSARPPQASSFNRPRPPAHTWKKPPRRRAACAIGFATASPLGDVDQPNIQAVRHAAKLLEDLGHDVQEASPALDGRAIAQAYLTLYLGQVAADVAASGAPAARSNSKPACWPRSARRSTPANTSPRTGAGTASPARWAGSTKPTTYGCCQPSPGRRRVSVSLLYRRAQQRILPLLSKLRAGRLMLRLGMLEQIAQESLSRTPFTQISNMTFTPSMSVPLGEGDLPVGVQFVARYGAEDVLLRLAGQLEMAAPWVGRRPK